MLLTVHQIDCPQDANHEKNAHCHDENGDLTPLSANRVRFRLDVRASKAIHNREMGRRSNGDLIKIFGFRLSVWVVAGDVENQMVLWLRGFVFGFSNPLGIDGFCRVLLELCEGLKIRHAKKQWWCTLWKIFKLVWEVIKLNRATHVQTVHSFRWRWLQRPWTSMQFL